ncbi:MAG: VirB3 family type IV secretion system protein [Rickettsiales bacterium]
MSQIKTDPLFLGLTRPATVFGVTYPFAVLNGFTCLLYFIVSNDFKGFLALPFFHAIAYMICAKEPLALDLIMMKGAKCTKCRNKAHFGANSYDVY